MIRLQGTIDYSVIYPKPDGKVRKLIGYCDSY